ncbi:MAG: tetratricopeptide repeat protein [Candidatus Saccharibacteria bacterium]|nr:tetratricopeptide repeat protein [Candidatus Saccharibacteria bacterium]
MFGLFFIVLLGIGLAFLKDPKQRIDRTSEYIVQRIDSIWKIAQKAFQEEKYLRAEKALLTILRIDEKNAAAYNRLGILYAKQENFSEAIECFEIAQSLEPTANNLHNVGLIYYNTGEYGKAAIAFEQAIEIDSSSASRFIAYAKVQEKLDDLKKEILALERAIEIEENPQTLKMLALAYHKDNREELARDLYTKATRLVEQQTHPMIEPKSKSHPSPRIIQ